MKKTTTERFEDKVFKEHGPGGCWTWTASRDSCDYGWFRLGSRMRRAHIVAHLLYIGEVADGLEVDHLCVVPSCVNPDHLEAVPRAENMRRSLGGKGGARGAFKRQNTHCPSGHPYSGDNLIIDAGYRRCRTCKNERQRKR